MELQDNQKAEEAFQEALTQHPESSAANRAAGNYYTSVEDFENAEHHFRHAFELDQEQTINLYSLARFYLMSGEPEKAEEAFKEAIRAPDAELSERAECARPEASGRASAEALCPSTY